MTLYKLRFLIATDSWEQVKKLFKDDLGITKDKKDDSVVPMRDHFVVEIELSSADLTNDFYEKIVNSKLITILTDELSQENARQILEMIAQVELKLRELAVYAYDLAATYKQIMNTKHKDAKQLLTNNQLVGESVADPLISFLDFGELIDFLGKTGNQVDESNLADDTARLMESSSSFDDFKKRYTKKFKKLSVWEIISEAVLVSTTDWSNIKRDLEVLKDIRNTALHHRTLTPAKTTEAKTITARLKKQFKTKAPEKKSVENMDIVFHSWNSELRGFNSYQNALARATNINTGAFQKMFESQFNSQATAQRALESIAKMQSINDTQGSALEALSRALNPINRRGLSSWVTEDKNIKPEAETNEDISTQEDSADEGEKI